MREYKRIGVVFPTEKFHREYHLVTFHTNVNSSLFCRQDPHYCRGNGPHSISELQRKGYVKWIPVNEFDSNSFYNVCLPQFNALCT